MKIYLFLFFLLQLFVCNSQNGITGDGFGGRLWYKPTNYSVGSYSGFTVCDKEHDNQLIGWGTNQSGELGVDPMTMFGSDVPVEVPNMYNVKYYTTGYNMAAIKQDNSGWVWGFSDFNYVPTQVISDVKFVDASMDFVSFIKNDGTVWSLGNNEMGNFGNNTMLSNFTNPVQMNGISNAVRVACSWTSNYILTSDGKVFVCGTGQGYSIGAIDTTITFSLEPLEMFNLHGIVDIKATSYGMLALDSIGDLYLFCPFYTGVSHAIKINSLSNIVAISGMCDGDFFLTLEENGNVYELYDLITIDNTASNAIDILAGETFSYIIKSDGSLWGKGGSSGGSIWLNLPDIGREEYTQIDVNQVPELCAVQVNQVVQTDCETIEVFMYQGNPPYQYNIGNGNQSSSIFTALDPGNYSITVTDSLGHIDTLSITVQANFTDINADFSFSPSNTTVLNGSSVQFTNLSSSNASISWLLNGDSISSDSIFDFTFTDVGTSCFELIATQSKCVDTNEVCFTVLDGGLFFPNIFTPNSDGDNDLFTLNPTGSVVFTATIVNRWGNKVAELSNSSPTWNGKVDGVDAVDGVYFITVDYSILGLEPQKYSGFFHLQR